MANKNGYSPRKLGTLLDIAHIVIGLVVIAMAFFAFVNPDRYRFLFPVIFFFAAGLNLLTGWFLLKMYPRLRKKRISGVIYIVVGVLILALCVISAISIWGSF